MFTHRQEDSERRPSADFVARFKEQHFSPINHQDHLKQEHDEQSHDINHMYDLDPTPKASTGAHFRLTPSLLDPNSAAFAALAAQRPAYCTPTPGGSALGLQSYETPEGFNTPDSLSHANEMMEQPAALFHPQFANLDQTPYMHFRAHPYAQDAYQNISIPGNAVGGAGYDSSSSNYSPGTTSADVTDQELYYAPEVHARYTNPGIVQNPDISGQYIPRNLACGLPCRFRFGTTLHASTAMLRHSSDIPVTYLNKRQAYTISVVDNLPPIRNNEVKRYRTTMRIAFDEEDQRRTASACWRLWKDGRGTMESGGNPDRLRAIDFEPVETRAINDKKGNAEAQLQIEESMVSFDRFTVTWSSTSHKPTVYFCVRFLFLSTDFSHSKGVKGVPVRLVAKTEFLGSGDSNFQNVMASELAYCKIKLFRDKGAERKLANDRQHLERQIEKLRQQAQQLTMSAPDTSPVSSKKKKRHSLSGGSTTATESPSSSPQRRHRRDWSISSGTSTVSPNPRSQQDEAQRKLDKAVAMEAMFASIRSSSAFSLIGDPADDPSLGVLMIAPQSHWEAPGVTFAADDSSVAQRNSPALSQASFSSTSERIPLVGTSPLVHPLSPPDATARLVGLMTQKVRVQAISKEVEAMDVDPFYVPVPPPAIRPAMCVYVTPAKIGPNGDPHTMHLPTAIDLSNDYYFAVYVPARTASSLTMAIATKMNIDPMTIMRTTIINKAGLRLILDDDVAREMLENQDMRIAVREIEGQKDGMTLDSKPSLELLLAY